MGVAAGAEEHEPGLAWDWGLAALGAVYALPAAVVALDDPALAVALAVGVLPAAILGLAPTRRGRLAVAAFGLFMGLPIFLGGLLAGVPLLAVAVIGLLGVGTAALAARSRLGMVAMLLSLPMVGIGLSYDDVGTAAELGGLMVAGSLFACLVSLPLPERRRSSAPSALAGTPPTIDYGIRLGAAGASAAAIGFLLDLDHVGWATAAALLVMRPAAEMQRLRSVGRILAVAAGALAAIALMRVAPPDGWYALAIPAALGGAAATQTSRWYVTPAFTTFLVFVMLLYSDLDSAGARFGERMVETALGVGLAYAFGLAVPALRGHRERPD